LRKGRIQYLCILLRFGNTLGCPQPSREHTCIGTCPTTQTLHTQGTCPTTQTLHTQGTRNNITGKAWEQGGMAFCQMGILFIIP
jgi:hypothetical protein